MPTQYLQNGLAHRDDFDTPTDYYMSKYSSMTCKFAHNYYYRTSS